MDEISFAELEKKIGLSFANKDLLKKAFTHGSLRGTPQGRDLETYRRLEFLGDAVIRLVTSKFVYERSGGDVETLHNRREMLVQDPPLAEVAQDLGMMNYLHWSGNEVVLKSRKVAARLYESLTGAIFLDKGYKTAANCMRNS